MFEQFQTSLTQTTARLVLCGVLTVQFTGSEVGFVAEARAQTNRSGAGQTVSQPIGFAGAIHRLLADADHAIARGDYERAYRFAVRAHKMSLAAGPVVADDPVCEPNGLAQFVQQIEAYRVPVKASVATTAGTPPSPVRPFEQKLHRVAQPDQAISEPPSANMLPPAPVQSGDPADDWTVAANVPRATPQNVIEPVRYFSGRAALSAERVELSSEVASGVTNLLQGESSSSETSPWERETVEPAGDLVWANPSGADSAPDHQGELPEEELVTPFAAAPETSVVTAEFADDTVADWAADQLMSPSQSSQANSEPIAVSHLPLIEAEPVAVTVADPETIPASDRLAEPLGIWKPRPPQQGATTDPDGLRVASASSIDEGELQISGPGAESLGTPDRAVKLVSLESWKSELAPTPAEAALQDAAVNPHWTEVNSPSTNATTAADRPIELPVAVKSVQVGVRHSPRQLAMLATLGGCGALVFALGAVVLLRVAAQTARRRSTTR